MANPFDPGYVQPPPSPSGSLTPGIIQTLAATKPWVRFCSIMGFISTGFMVLMGLITMASGAFIGAAGVPNAGTAAGINVVSGIFYIVFAGLYLFPSIKLWKFGTSILNLMMSQSITHLDEAMEQQRGFWKFVGIMALVTIAMWLLFIVIMVVFGGMMATRSPMPTVTPMPSP